MAFNPIGTTSAPLPQIPIQADDKLRATPVATFESISVLPPILSGCDRVLTGEPIFLETIGEAEIMYLEHEETDFSFYPRY